MTKLPDPPVRSPSAQRPTRVVAREMVGRDSELELLVEVLAVAPSVAVVEGEAGIGKTRLISEAAARLAGDGDASGECLRWLVGGCRRIREPFPLGPVIEALRGLEDELRGVRLSAVAGALRPLLPELASVLPSRPEPLDDRAAERHRVFRALAELLGAVGPVVLVLEDLHWVDEQTCEFLTYLLADLPARLSVVVTYRGEDVDPAVRALTAKLPASLSPGVALRRAEVVLGPLDAEQTGVLAASILNAERVSGEFAAHLRERASGVPFAIEELLAVLRARGTLTSRHGAWSRRRLDELDVPSGIRDPVLERVSRLSDDARAVVEAAGVLQEPAPVAVLIASSRLDGERVLHGVEEALDSGLLTERGDGDAVGWRHVLAAQAVYGAMPGPRRKDLHGRAATALETLDQVPLGRLAYHLKHAGRLDEWAAAAEKAADQAIELGHDAEAVHLLEDVLRRVHLVVEDRGRLAVKLGRAANESLHVPQDLMDLLGQVLKQDLPYMVRGELRFWLALIVARTGGDAVTERRLFNDAVVDLNERPDLQAWAMVALSALRDPRVAPSEYRRWSRRALQVLDNVEDPAFRVFLLGKLAMARASVCDPWWRTLTARIVKQGGHAPRRRREVNAYYSVGMTACYVGHYDTAEQLLSGALGGVAACESKRLELMIRAELVLLAFLRGSWDGLEEAVNVLLIELADYPLAHVDVELTAACMALAHGDPDEADRRLNGVAAQLETMGTYNLFAIAVGTLSRLAAVSGEVADAVTWVDRLLTALESNDVWAPLARALPSVTQLLIKAGREPDARALIERCARELQGLDAPLAPAAVAHARGFLAADQEQAVAAEHFLDAAKLYDALECPYEAAQAREQAGLALAAAEDARAEELVRAALAVYERLGASWDAARCTRMARSRGLRLPVTYRGGRKGYGGQLSPRENEVARLAADGYTNKEIGAELFLSPSTVNKHLGRAMRKLGVHTRAALAGHLPDPPG